MHLITAQILGEALKRLKESKRFLTNSVAIMKAASSGVFPHEIEEKETTLADVEEKIKNLEEDIEYLRKNRK